MDYKIFDCQSNDTLVNESDINNNISNSNNNDQIQQLLCELAEKDEALICAAQFGKILIEQKEELERQYDQLKADQQKKFDIYEQETFELKNIINSLRNEYEQKIYDLNDDLKICNKNLNQKELALKSIKQKLKTLDDEDDHDNNLNRLTEENKKLNEKIKKVEINLREANEKCENYCQKLLTERDAEINETKTQIKNLDKDYKLLIDNRNELEFALLQACDEKDNKTKLIEEFTSKYLFLQSEKNNLDHLIYKQENQIFKLKRINQEIVKKLEKYEKININKQNNLNRKRWSNKQGKQLNNTIFQSQITKMEMDNSFQVI
jgi:chromosome segregation ATPase